MKISEKQKGAIHFALLGLAVVCGIYNATKTKPKNKVLTLFYGIVIGVEVCCVIDHCEGELDEQTDG